LRRHRPPKQLLSAKRSKVKKEIKAITAKLRNKSGTATHAGPELTSLRSTLQGLQHQVKAAGGPGAADVVSALGHLDTSLKHLATVSAAGDPEKVINELVAGVEAFQQAHSAAKAAGHNWVL
jgi:type VI protein secretion system component VasF